MHKVLRPLRADGPNSIETGPSNFIYFARVAVYIHYLDGTVSVPPTEIQTLPVHQSDAYVFVPFPVNLYFLADRFPVCVSSSMVFILLTAPPQSQ